MIAKSGLPDVAAWSEAWTLSSGEQVTARAIRPSDAKIEQAFVHDLSPESRYSRFMGDISQLSPEMLDQFTHIHYPHDLALIVTIPEDGVEREIAVARYITLADSTACEFAIVVADAWQHHGIGHRLMRALIGFARAGGLARMEGYVLAMNRGMLELMHSLGFACGPSAEGPQVRLVSMDLGAPCAT